MLLPRALVAILLLPGAGCLAADPGAPGLLPPPRFVADCSIATGEPAWPDPCTALASWNPSPSKAEVDLVVNPKDADNVIVASKDLDRKAGDCTWSVAQVTKDGGRSWKTVYVGGDKQNREPLVAPYRCITDPILAFDEGGYAYYALEAYDTSDSTQRRVGNALPALPIARPNPVGSAFVLARSTDGGSTWDRYLLQHAGDADLVFHDFTRMLVSPTTGAVHTIWNGIGRAGVSPWVSTTRDRGETVDPPVTFFARDAPRDTLFNGGFAATNDGTLWVTTTKSLAFDAGRLTDVFLFRSDDDGRTFEEVSLMQTIVPVPRQAPGQEFRTVSFMDLAADRSGGPNDGRLWGFWTDYRHKVADVLSIYSDDGGATWSDPIAVTEGLQGDEFFPRSAVGPDGTVVVLFLSRANDPKLLDAVLASSEDGAVWQTVRLTASGFDGDLGIHQDGFRFIGDYNGIAVDSEGTVHAGWADTRTGVAEIAYAKVRDAYAG